MHALVVISYCHFFALKIPILSLINIFLRVVLHYTWVLAVLLFGVNTVGKVIEDYRLNLDFASIYRLHLMLWFFLFVFFFIFKYAFLGLESSSNHSISSLNSWIWWLSRVSCETCKFCVPSWVVIYELFFIWPFIRRYKWTFTQVTIWW